MPHPHPEQSAVVYDIWKKIDNSADPQEPPRPPRQLTWVKARSFPYFLTKAKAQAELDEALSQRDATVKTRYKIVSHQLTVRMLELDVAQGKVALWHGTLALMVVLQVPAPPRQPAQPCHHARPTDQKTAPRK